MVGDIHEGDPGADTLNLVHVPVIKQPTILDPDQDYYGGVAMTPSPSSMCQSLSSQSFLILIRTAMEVCGNGTLTFVHVPVIKQPTIPDPGQDCYGGLLQ